MEKHERELFIGTQFRNLYTTVDTRMSRVPIRVYDVRLFVSARTNKDLIIVSRA